LENLVRLQTLHLEKKPLTPEDETELKKLRETVPATILVRFDRLIARGKKGVATVRHGVCSECHLRIPSGTLASLAYTTEMHVCDNCGRYLFLPEDEPLGLAPAPATPKTPAKRTRKKGGAGRLEP
jgi:predicted  nucleic acid-binding Zn-ribbon protein